MNYVNKFLNNSILYILILVYKTLENIHKSLDKNTKELFKSIITVENMIINRLKESDALYNLILDEKEKSNIFGNLNTYIPGFMDELWKNPKSVAIILLNADKNDIRKKLASFVVNKLYYNIFSVNHKDDQLIYIISLLLQNEINSLTDINASFLKDSKCGIILEELIKKKEVKEFFKKVILDSMKESEIVNSSLNICLDINKIIKKYENIFSLTKENYYKTYEKIINRKIKLFNENEDRIKLRLINEKYINLKFCEEELKKKINEYKSKDMIDFIDKIIAKCTSSPNKYLNKNLFDNINDYREKIINYYINSFIEASEFVDKLLDKLLKYSEILPYSIKCICKIITILINKKFPKNTKIERNKFLVNFFFDILFFPCLIKPSFNAYINEIMISKRMINKLTLVKELLINITLGILFEQNYLTPFNWYIVEKMPKIFEIFDSICQVTLPPFIDKLINDELPENYEYNYFKENTDEDNIYRIICYNINELYALVTIAEKYKNEISINDKVLSKLKRYYNKIIEIKDNLKYKDNDNNIAFYDIHQEINCFLEVNLINKDEKINKIFNLKKHKNYFSLDELKEIDTKEKKIESDIIKIKNCFYAFLYNYEMISKNDIKKEKLGDIINILDELNNHSNMKSTTNINNIYIPSNWYINSLIQNLSILPNNLKENDFKQLLDELEAEITNSLKNINFEQLNKLIKYIKELEKEISYFENVKKIIIDIDLNEIADNFIKNNRIILKLEDKDAIFFKNLMDKNGDFSSLFLKDDKNNIIFNSINYFLSNFPDISKYQLNYDINYFELMSGKKIPEIINTYLALTKNNLTKEIKLSKEICEEVYNKIYDYIMENLYDKLFPKEIIKDDVEIYQNCYKHIWVQLTNLLDKNKNYIFDNFLPDSNYYFKQFEKEKSPRKKLIALNKIINCIYNLVQFNDDEIEFNEEISLLNYSFIKSKPERIYSNYHYIDLFLLEKEGFEANQLAKIKGVFENVRKMTSNKLYNINETDYLENCKLVSKGIIY